MKTKKSIENNLDEVIFEKRNKEYGAYFLRKTYDKNVSKALTISITVLLIIVSIPLIANYMHTGRLIRENITVGAEMIGINKIKESIPIPPPPLPEVISKKVIFRVPIIVDSTDQGSIFTQADLNEQKGNEKIIDSIIIVDNDQTDKRVIEDKEAKEIHNYSGVEEKPYFPGGDAGMNDFILANTKYPKLASENKIQGKVLITFIVEVDGSISNVNVLKGVGAGCDEEAERVVKMMPNWIPGKQNNKSVRVQVLVPIKFIIVQ